MKSRQDIDEAVGRVFTNVVLTESDQALISGGTDLGVGFYGGHYDSRGGSYWIVAQTSADAVGKLNGYWKDMMGDVGADLSDEIESGPIHLITNIKKLISAFGRTKDGGDLLPNSNAQGFLLSKGGKDLALLVWEGEKPVAPKGYALEEAQIGEDAWNLMIIKNGPKKGARPSQTHPGEAPKHLAYAVKIKHPMGHVDTHAIDTETGSEWMKFEDGWRLVGVNNKPVETAVKSWLGSTFKKYPKVNDPDLAATAWTKDQSGSWKPKH